MPKAALVWWSKVDFRLIEWVPAFMWEHTGRGVRDDFVCLVDISRSEDVIIYQNVVAEEGGVLSRCIRHIISNTTRGMFERCPRCTLHLMFLNKPPTMVPVHVTSPHRSHIQY